MPFTNADNRHFTEPEKTAINAALTTLENALAPKLANLTADERKKYGSVNEHNKLVINKVKDFRETHPALSSPDVDWVEFNNDYATRGFIQNTMQRFQTIINGLQNAKILHDFDNYNAALTDYDYAKYKSGNMGHTQNNGFQSKVDVLSDFFAGRPTVSSSEKKSNPEAE